MSQSWVHIEGEEQHRMREHACIALKVPRSGNAELDALILESRRLDLMGQIYATYSYGAGDAIEAANCCLREAGYKIADVRQMTLEEAVPEMPDDIKGRFQSELFWRGAYAMREAIRARLGEGK